MNIGTSNENADSKINGGMKIYNKKWPDKLTTYCIDLPKTHNHGEPAPMANPIVKSIGV